ncbi:hypothetical protein [Pseudoduganella sp. R-43]
MSGIQVDLKLIAGWEDWQHEVLNARDEVARWTSEHAPVPTFGFCD